METAARDARGVEASEDRLGPVEWFLSGKVFITGNSLQRDGVLLLTPGVWQDFFLGRDRFFSMRQFPSPMSLGLAFWVIWLVWFIFGAWSTWPLSAATARPAAGNLILFILLFLIGYKCFGAPIHL